MCLYLLLHLACDIDVIMISQTICRRFNPYETNVSVRRLHKVKFNWLGKARAEGVSIVDNDNGTMKLSVVPTRGMNVLQDRIGNVRMGWDSPVTKHFELLACWPVLQRFGQVLASDLIDLFKVRKGARYFEQSMGRSQ